MKSPKQIRFSSTPKKVTLAKGAETSSPLANSRVTPTSKTQPTIYPPTFR